MGVVALPGDGVDADAVAQLEPGRVGDVAGQDVVAEHIRRELAAEVVVQPRLVAEVAVGPVQIEGDPADATLGEGDLEIREPPQRRSEQQVLGNQGGDLAGEDDQVVDGRFRRLLDQVEAGADVKGQDHVLVSTGPGAWDPSGRTGSSGSPGRAAPRGS